MSLPPCGGGGPESAVEILLLHPQAKRGPNRTQKLKTRIPGDIDSVPERACGKDLESEFDVDSACGRDRGNGTAGNGHTMPVLVVRRVPI
jgi:hypothetical protein